MIVVTANRVSSKRVARTLGLVRGNTIRARHIGKDVMAVFRNIVGGEVSEYTKLLAESREQEAIDAADGERIAADGERNEQEPGGDAAPDQRPGPQQTGKRRCDARRGRFGGADREAAVPSVGASEPGCS